MKANNPQALSNYFNREEEKETLNKRPLGLSEYKDGREKTFKKVHRYETGAVYNGHWNGGLRHGVGEQQWPDGSKYVGEWEDGKAYGKGKFFHSDGDYYEGDWCNNKACGFGLYIHENGD